MYPQSAIIGLLLICALQLSPAFAQEEDIIIGGMLPDSIVVTAARQEVDERQTGRRVSVWTAEDIKAMPISSFDELLRTVAGVEIQSRGGFGVQSDITIRGSTFNGVLVLLDGLPINDPMTGHFLADFPVPISEIARIEVLRGPASALYGPDALGGVVQIFTRTGLYEARGSGESLHGEIGAVGGSYGLYGADGAGWYRHGRSLLSAATSYRRSNGMPILNEAGEPMQSSVGPVRTGFERQTHTIARAGRLGSTILYTRAGMDKREFGAYHFYTPFASDTAREATSTYWLQARLSDGTGGQTTWRVNVAGKQHEDEYIYNPQVPASRHTSRKLMGQLQLSHRFSPCITLTGGLAGSYRSIDSNTMGVHADGAAGTFLLARWHPQERLYINAGSRLNYDPSYGLEPTPQVSAAYNLPWITFRGNVGRAVRAPNYVERYITSGRNRGNPDLQPERAWSYEAGVDVYPAPRLELHVTGFLRNANNLIDYVRPGPSTNLFTARNILQVDTKGLELEAQWRRRLSDRQQIRLTAAYTWLDADLSVGEDVPETATFKYALTKARHLIQGTAAYTINRVTFSLQGFWKQRMQTIPAHVGGRSYNVINARIAYRLPLGKQHLTISAEVRNLLNTQYTEIFDAPMPDRWGIIGLRLVR